MFNWYDLEVIFAKVFDVNELLIQSEKCFGITTAADTKLYDLII